MLIKFGIIGGSGLDDPKILKDFNDLDAFDLKVEDNRIILDVIKNPRDGWADKFKNSKNDLLIDDALDIKDWDEL